jgi:ribosome-binding protein aMBF1 (putative translation factor)
MTLRRGTDVLIDSDKVRLEDRNQRIGVAMTKQGETISPIGRSHKESMRRRARDPEYRAELERLAPYEALARIVIRRRGQLGLSQAELAQRMGTSHSAISRIESGRHPTTVQTLRRLAAALQTHLVVGFVDEIAGLSEASGADARVADLIAVG